MDLLQLPPALVKCTPDAGYYPQELSWGIVEAETVLQRAGRLLPLSEVNPQEVLQQYGLADSVESVEFGVYEAVGEWLCLANVD